MDADVQLQASKHKKINYKIISLMAFILIMLVVTAQFTYTILKREGIYKGVYIENINIGDMTTGEAENVLNSAFQDKIGSLDVTLKSKSSSQVIKYSDLNLSYDIKGAVDEAYSVGRTGNIFKRLHDIYKAGKNGTQFSLPISYDREKLDEAIGSYYNKTFVSVKQFDLAIQSDSVTIKSGHHGESIDKALLLKEIDALLQKGEEKTIEVPVIITQPDKINVDELYSQITAEPKDAVATVENNTVKVASHVMGRKIDKSVLAGIAAQLESTENTEQVLPVTLQLPEITTDIANKAIFRDTLATYSTRFSTSNENSRNRGENIKLVVSKIAGKILSPGEVFSFNQTVGPRNEEGGFKAAHVYVSGKVVDGIGGGICQASSTLYNAVLYSDLDVVERRNHMFTVGYVPKGNDATVSYGSTDFRFKNSTRWPLKIDAKVTKDNNVIFTLIGTNETPGKEIVISPKIVKTIDFKTKYVDDPTLPAGTTKVSQEGMTGYVVDSYKITKQDGKIVSQKKLYTSTYKALEKIVLRGTKKADGTTAPPSVTQTPPSETQTGVDDADNPPASPSES
jgi:vancomycin resistance protein YoaR